MKKINLFFLMLGLSFAASFVSCSSDDSSGGPTGPVNTGELKLFLIDTAKVNTISATGTNETTILNKKVNTSSYIGYFALSEDGTKFAYTEHQTSGTFPNLVYSKEVRMANSDGTGDMALFSSTDAQLQIGALKVGGNGKVYFITQNFMDNIKKLNSVNFDGTGLESKTMGYNITDVANDGSLFTTEVFSSPTQKTMQIIDPAGDNGAGGLYHNETFSLESDKFFPVFTRDGKSVMVAYLENQTIKMRIINIAAKTSTTVNLIPNFTETMFGMSMSMASDSNRGVITIATYDDSPSKTYVFNVATATVTSTFNNNDDNIFDVFAF